MQKVLATAARIRDPDNTQGTSTSSRYGLRSSVMTQTKPYLKGRTDVKILENVSTAS